MSFTSSPISNSVFYLISQASKPIPKPRIVFTAFSSKILYLSRTKQNSSTFYEVLFQNQQLFLRAQGLPFVDSQSAGNYRWTRAYLLRTCNWVPTNQPQICLLLHHRGCHTVYISILLFIPLPTSRLHIFLSWRMKMTLAIHSSTQRCRFTSLTFGYNSWGLGKASRMACYSVSFLRHFSPSSHQC